MKKKSSPSSPAPFHHPVTGERLYTPEEFDNLTTAYIDQQCEILRANLRKKRSLKTVSNIYA